MALGIIPDCDLAKSPPAATRPASARASRFSILPRAPKSRRSCARSRRLKPRSSRVSRTISSPRWRSPTSSTPSQPRQGGRAAQPKARETGGGGGEDMRTRREAGPPVTSGPRRRACRLFRPTAPGCQLPYPRARAPGTGSTRRRGWSGTVSAPSPGSRPRLGRLASRRWAQKPSQPIRRGRLRRPSGARLEQRAPPGA